MSIAKSMTSNFVPPLQAVREHKDNTHWFTIASFILIGLTVGALMSTIIVNSMEIKEEVENDTK